MTKEEIVLMNKKLGIETVFSSELKTPGKIEGKVIYINDNYEDLEKINKHEILHLYEDSEIFKKIKKRIFDTIYTFDFKYIGKLNGLREKYRSLYYELYKDEENINELIDNEIAIDLIVENEIISFNTVVNQIIDGFNTIISNAEQKPTSKRYMNISLSKKIDQQFPKLNIYEKLYLLNYYPTGLPTGNQKYETVYLDIQNELERLYEYAEDENNFKIAYIGNEELERLHEAEIGLAIERGDREYGDYLLSHKKSFMFEQAAKYSTSLQEEYKHIVEFIKDSYYDDAFKCLILKETLTKIYKLENIDGDNKIITTKRDNHRSISGHMTINQIVLDIIYENIEKYNNFADLYFYSLEKFNYDICQNYNYNIEGLNCFKKGRWLKFSSKENDPKNYIENVQNLSSLVQCTQWCTKNLASSHLEQGDFYVFIDTDNKPHIAIKMNDNEIDQIRGLNNGMAQELEEEYRDVLIEFLTKNKSIESGTEWLEKEEWNRRLINYKRKIEDETLEEEELNNLLYDLFKFEDYRAQCNENSNKIELFRMMSQSEYMRDLFASKFNCEPEEVHIGNLTSKNIDEEIFPYKVVIGNLNMNCSSYIDMSNLSIIIGNACFDRSQIEYLDNLEIILGNASFKNTFIEDLPSLEKIDGVGDFSGSNITYLQSLQEVKDIIGNDELLEFIEEQFEFVDDKYVRKNRRRR